MKESVKLISTTNEKVSDLVDVDGVLEINESDLRTTFTPYLTTSNIKGLITVLTKFYFEEDGTLVLETYSGQQYCFQGLIDDSPTAT